MQEILEKKDERDVVLETCDILDLHPVLDRGVSAQSSAPSSEELEARPRGQGSERSKVPL